MDIAELGYSIDSSGLTEANKALDQNVSASERAGAAASSLEQNWQRMVSTMEANSKALGDRLTASLSTLVGSSSAMLAELQQMNRAQADHLAGYNQMQTNLANLESRLSGTTAATNAQALASERAAQEAQAAAINAARQTQALAEQDARLRAVAQAGVAFAESMKGANVSDRALAEAALATARGIDVQAQAMARAGTEQERMAARAKALELAEARVANEARDAAMAAEAQSINLGKLLGQIDPTVAGLNRLADMEERLERAHRAGLINTNVFDQYQAKIDTMRVSTLAGTNALGQMGMTAGQTRQAMRMLPMQITDITTSLVSGQPAWMVAIQQGGQLKDQFGGIGPAARAVSGYIMGLVNPFTVAAAAVAGLGAALHAHQQDLSEFNNALLTTGGYAGVMAADLGNLTAQLSAFAGVTSGGAHDALVAVAASGKFTGQQFEMVAATAARMQSAVGQSLDSTIRKYAEIAKDPVDALLKLNETERFLTYTELDRVKALVEAGRATDAATEALYLYDQRQQQIIDQARAGMPRMSAMWQDVKGDISGAWSELKTYSDLLANVISQQRESRDMSFSGSMRQLAQNSGSLAGLIPEGWLSNGASLANALAKRALGQAGGGRPAGPMPANIEDLVDSEVARKTEEQTVAFDAAAKAVDRQAAALDRLKAKELARLDVLEMYDKLSPDDPRRMDGSVARLIAQAEAEVDKRFDRNERGSTKLTEAQKDAKALERAYESLNSQMARQIGLYGQTTRVAQVNYDLQFGSLRGLSAARAAEAIGQAAQLDALDRQKAALEGLARLRADLNRLDGQGVALVKERIRILDENRGEGTITDAEYSEELKRVLSAGSKPPDFNGLDAMYGGAAGQFDSVNKAQEQLQLWYSDRLAQIDAARQSEAQVNAEYDAQALDAHARYTESLNEMDRARGRLAQQVAYEAWANVTDTIKVAFGEQSDAYKAAFAIQKAAAIAMSIVAIQKAQADMLAQGATLWDKLGGAAVMAAQGASIVSNIAAVGMAHDGIDSVPKDGTWLLQKGERVMTSETSAKLDATLGRIGQGGGGGGGTYAPTMIVHGQPDGKTLAAMRSMLDEHGRKYQEDTYQRVAADVYQGTGDVGRGLRAGNNVPRRLK